MKQKLFISIILIIVILFILLIVNYSYEEKNYTNDSSIKKLEKNIIWKRVYSLHQKYLKSDSSGKKAKFDSLDLSEKSYFNRETTGGYNNWTNSSFIHTNLSYCRLINVDLSNSDFSSAIFIGTDFKGDYDHNYCILNNSNLFNAVFEPYKLPDPYAIAYARNLHTLKYKNNPAALVKLKNSFHDAGFIDQERQIIYALMNEKTKRINNPFHKNIRIFFFKWTCEYGMEIWRPLFLLFIITITFSLSYILFTIFSKESKIWISANPTQKGNLWTNIDPSDLKNYLKRIWKLARYSLLFSLMSAFNYGFRDINFGRWIRNLLPDNIDIVATKYLRTISGIQSVLCLYLLALWIFNYLGRPFEQLI